MEFNLADMWELVVDTVGDHPAVVDGSRHFTFREVDERANRLAHVLRDLGVTAGDHVALYLHNCAEYLEGMLAAFKLRAVPINVNYRYVEDELRYLFNDSHTVAVLHHPEFAPRIEAIRSQLPRLRVALAVDDDYESLLRHTSPERDFEPRHGDDLYILYTGGTTGMPKGVMWRQHDLFFAALGGGAGGREPIKEPEELVERCRRARVRCVAACPLMHGSAHWMALSTLLTGGCVVVADTRHFDPVVLLELIASEHANYVVIVGDAYARPLTEALEARPALRARLECLSVVVSGGAILSPTVKQALLAQLTDAIIVDGYGASETGGQGQSVTANGSPEAPTRFRLDDTTAILDDELRPVGAGVVGRIARTGHIPIGYYNDPHATAVTFPEIDGVRWAVPGDHARREDDGTVRLLGRGALCINTGGEKVYPDEVESVLKAHPLVFDCVVVGQPDERFGERVVALVQLRSDGALDAESLTIHARAHLAGYKVPRHYIEVPRIVRSPSGKPDYRWAAAVARTR